MKKMKLVVAAAALGVLVGCASLSARVGPEAGIKPAQQDTVTLLLCQGQEAELAAYFEARMTDHGARIEMLAAGRKAKAEGGCK